MPDAVSNDIDAQQERLSDLQALDLLPQEVRRAIMYSPARHSPSDVLKAMRADQTITESMVLDALALKNAEMSEQYRQAMAAGALSKRTTHDDSHCSGRRGRHRARQVRS